MQASIGLLISFFIVPWPAGAVEYFACGKSGHGAGTQAWHDRFGVKATDLCKDQATYEPLPATLTAGTDGRCLVPDSAQVKIAEILNPSRYGPQPPGRKTGEENGTGPIK
jgi:hypothetical protein